MVLIYTCEVCLEDIQFSYSLKTKLSLMLLIKIILWLTGPILFSILVLFSLQSLFYELNGSNFSHLMGSVVWNLALVGCFIGITIGSYFGITHTIQRGKQICNIQIQNNI